MIREMKRLEEERDFCLHRFMLLPGHLFQNYPMEPAREQLPPLIKTNIMNWLCVRRVIAPQQRKDSFLQ